MANMKNGSIGQVRAEGSSPRMPVDCEISFNSMVRYLENGRGPLKKAGRRPGAEQLLTQFRIAVRKNVGEGFCEVYECGWALYDNGDRWTVLWAPEAAREAQYQPMRLYTSTGKQKTPEEQWEAVRMSRKGVEYRDPGMDRADEEVLREMPWYLAVMLAGENGIERNLSHPLYCRRGNVEESGKDENGRGCFLWSSSPAFELPEAACLRKEAEAERRAALTEKQLEVYQLYYQEGMTQREAAQRLGINQNAVKKRLRGVAYRLREVEEKERLLEAAGNGGT